jgi:two-component system sensor histidine kinase PhoQ
MKSLRTRLLVVASLVLAVFMLLCGAGLEKAFRSSAEQVQHDKMQGLIYALLAAAESDENGELSVPTGALPDSRLARVDSGLDALIFDEHGNVVWASPGFTGAVPTLQAPEIGNTIFRDLGNEFALTYGVRWVSDSSTLNLFGGTPKPRRFTVAIIEDKTAYRAQLAVFRQTLWVGLGSSSIALMLVQILVLSWGLAPLRRLAAEVHRIEAGLQPRILSSYPTELTPLTEGLNVMIQSERSQQMRHRNALGDLAHSLKTPLAVLRGVVENIPPTYQKLRSQFEEPLQRLQDITEYQLKRASAAGRRTLSEPIAPRPIAERTIAALTKVHAQKRIEFINDVPERLRLRVDDGDLYELFGNLLDNASKYCRKRVRIVASIEDRRVRIDVDDDGTGFPPDAEELLKRGVRADSLTPGQGIGLAQVADIVALNDGVIELMHSELGGARVRMSWPV